MIISGRILYLLNPKEALVFRNLTFYLVNLNDCTARKIASLPVSLFKKILGSINLSNRLLRMEPKCVGKLSDNNFVVSVLHHLWLLDLQKKEVRSISDERPGFSQVLNFCSDGDSLYWGDYGANANKNEVFIYRMDSSLKIKVLYKFPAGNVRHIHNIVFDKNDKSFWVLTGDNEPLSGIYKTSADWNGITTVKVGQQKYRAVVAFPYQGGLVYATDSVETDNYIYYIDKRGSVKMIAPVNGSCIYGTETKDFFVISTTVEPHEGGGLKKMLSNQLGGGIKSRDVHILLLSKNDLSVKVVKKYRKDFWPMKLFQYGRAPFASGQLSTDTGVWCYPIACVGTKGKSEFVKF